MLAIGISGIVAAGAWKYVNDLNKSNALSTANADASATRMLMQKKFERYFLYAKKPGGFVPPNFYNRNLVFREVSCRVNPGKRADGNLSCIDEVDDSNPLHRTYSFTLRNKISDEPNTDYTHPDSVCSTGRLLERCQSITVGVGMRYIASENPGLAECGCGNIDITRSQLPVSHLIASLNLKLPVQTL